jgi:hydrogenase/urease accessory protein HupE
MRRKAIFFGAVSSAVVLAASAAAHNLPLSYVDLRVNASGMEASVEAPARSFAQALKSETESPLLDPSHLAGLSQPLLSMINSHLVITVAGTMVPATLKSVEPLPGRADLRVSLTYAAAGPVESAQIACTMFAADPRHRTFLNIYDGEQLRRQAIFDQKVTTVSYERASKQGKLEVIRQFIFEGIHHIFIGPDHILFIVGLLLLGGTVGQLLKIVTAFTLAHSVTLGLATLNIVTPPPRLIEPAIALSIIFVGAHALLEERGGRDWRVIFAFGFGFIHGFGFANVLREMALPRAALGWALFSFNFGVELGQACIVLAITPLIALIYRRGEVVGGRFAMASSLAVVFAGAYWFAERAFGRL